MAVCDMNQSNHYGQPWAFMCGALALGAVILTYAVIGSATDSLTHQWTASQLRNPVVVQLSSQQVAQGIQRVHSGLALDVTRVPYTRGSGTAVQQVPSSPLASSLFWPSSSSSIAVGAVVTILMSLLVFLRAQQPVMAMMAQTGAKVPVPGAVELDTEAVVRYIAATTLQWGLLTGTLYLLDQGVARATEAAVPSEVLNALVVIFFLFTAIRSRVFSPLDNSRPTVAKEKAAIDELKRPSWMPPPLTFPIVWSTIALLRTASSFLIWQHAGQTLCIPPLLLYFLTLCIGDTWNTINNVEKRLGTAVIGVVVVWGAALATDVVYWSTVPLAGQVLLPQSVWLSIAAVLVTSIWKINGAEPLYPYRPRQR